MRIRYVITDEVVSDISQGNRAGEEMVMNHDFDKYKWNYETNTIESIVLEKIFKIALYSWK